MELCWASAARSWSHQLLPLLQTTNTKKTGDMSLDRATFCKLAALKSSVGNNTSYVDTQVTHVLLEHCESFSERVDDLPVGGHAGGKSYLKSLENVSPQRA